MHTEADWKRVRANLAFTCTHEADHLPALDPDADQLFKYARWLQKQNGKHDFNEIARYYRIAAAYGHYKANNNLQGLLSGGYITNSPNTIKEVITLADQLISQNIPGGYFDMGRYLELGYGMKQDLDMALRYYRKAADMGSPDAQYYVGDLLSPRDKAPDISRQMMQCAANQGFEKAAKYLGFDLQTGADKSYPKAAIAFQKAVAAGSSLAAYSLEIGFGTDDPSNRGAYLGFQKDPERSRRYELIGKFLDSNDGRNPKVPDIDQIVPLPPAKLPPWDGTFQWQKEWRTMIPPKPPEDLVNRLARAKNLDPATGLSLAFMKQAQEDRDRLPLGIHAKTGEPCPQSGIWRLSTDVRTNAVTRRIEKGETMPPMVYNDPRLIPGLDALLGMRTVSFETTWTLEAYKREA